MRLTYNVMLPQYRLTGAPVVALVSLEDTGIPDRLQGFTATLTGRTFAFGPARIPHDRSSIALLTIRPDRRERLKPLILDGETGHLTTVYEPELRTAFPAGTHAITNAAAAGLRSALTDLLGTPIANTEVTPTLAAIGGGGMIARVVAVLPDRAAAPRPRRRPAGAWT